MKLTRLLNRSLGLALCAAALAIGSPASAQTTITALTGGDSDEGLNLTGLNVIYAINQGLSPTAETIQGVNFIAAPINLFTFTGYGGNVVLSNLNRTGPGFSPVGWGSTANDLAMIAVNGQISYGSFGQFAYAVTAGNQYTVFSIISPGSIGGRPGDVAFFGGLASSFSQGTVIAGSVLLADNLDVATNNASVVSYTYTAAATGFNTLIVAGSDTYGTPTGADQNAVASGFLVAQTVPEPGTVTLLGAAGLALLAYRRRGAVRNG